MANGEQTVTRAELENALTRIERHGKESVDDLEKLMSERDKRYDGERQEIHRRLSDLNNSHDKAIQEKRRTDEAALKVQEQSVTKDQLQAWKDEVNKRLDTQAGTTAGQAKVWAFVMGIGAILINLLIRFIVPGR